LSTATNRLLKNYCGAGLRCCRSLKNSTYLRTPRVFARLRLASRPPHDVFQLSVRGACCLLITLALAGCAPLGLLYTDTVVPFSKKFDETPIGTKRCVIESQQIKEPITRYNIYAEWSWDFILTEAKKAGISDIYYMDKRTLSILFGVYKRESLRIYGD